MGRGFCLVWMTGAVVVAIGAAATTAVAAVTLGPNPLPERSSVVTSGGARIFTNAVVPGATLASPIDGIVTRWRVRRGDGPGVLIADTIALRILRPTGVANGFTAQGTSDPHSVPGGSSDPIDVYEFPTTLPIKAGDRVGLGTTLGAFTSLNQIGAGYLTRTNALADGQSAVFTPGAFPDKAVLINADVEPDANCNGLADESQESVVSGGCLPPKAVSLVSKKAKAKKGALALEVVCVLAGGHCTGNQISLTGKAPKPVAARKVILASASLSIPAGQSQIVSLRLTKRARKLLKRLGKIKATATITGGAATTVSTLTIKAKRGA